MTGVAREGRVPRPQGVLDLLNIIFEIERDHKSLEDCKAAIERECRAARERFKSSPEKMQTMKWIMNEYKNFYGWGRTAVQELSDAAGAEQAESVGVSQADD